jgi:hypothetical protein
MSPILQNQERQKCRQQRQQERAASLPGALTSISAILANILQLNKSQPTAEGDTEKERERERERELES